MVLTRGRDEVASWPLERRGRCDLAMVDHVARLQLGAGRLGCTIRLRNAEPVMWELIGLMGLAQVVLDADASGGR